MTTTPAPAEPTIVEPPAETTTSTTPPVVTEEPEPVEISTQPTPAPTTTAPATPTSPQVAQPIIPLVIAHDGLKCAQPESYTIQSRHGPVLMCPNSIQP
jgi:hypothetical protein